jgi:histone-lysine N-methyltransferase SETD2
MTNSNSVSEGWKLAVDDEGRCYYYHIQTRQTQWHPPTAEDCETALLESSESSDSEAIDDDEAKDETSQPDTSRQAGVTTIRTKVFARSQRRKKSGLVQERIINVSEISTKA